MIVVSDASPLTNLARIGQLQILKLLYERIVIPTAVRDELKAGERLGAHASFLDNADWIVVQSPADKKAVARLLTSLDLGEAEAIVLALETRADLLLMDERAGRRIAAQFDIRTVGLMGTLLLAKRRKLISQVTPVVDQLISQCGFWIDQQLRQEIMRQAGE